MTLFADIDDQLLEIIHKFAKGRKVVDCGAGECLFEYKYKEKYPDADVISIEMFPHHYDNFYIDEDNILKFDAVSFPWTNNDLPLFIRPCHSQAFMPAVLESAKAKCSQALYLSNTRNIGMDIPEGYTYFPVPGYVGKDDDERLFLIKLQGEEYVEKKDEWYWVKLSSHWKEYGKMKKIMRNGEPWFVNSKGGGLPTKIVTDFKKVQESLKYLKLYKKFK